NEKHNLANGEGNRDGDSHNNSWNCGVEGPTDDPAILALRQQQMKNMLTTLLLSQGVPMIRMGDEIAHSQGGNNNAYCQDNDISWINWNLTDSQREMFEFCCQVVKVWRNNPVFQRRNFFQGQPIRGQGQKDIHWYGAHGKEMTDNDWHAAHARCLGVLLNGEMTDEVDERGRQINGQTTLLLLNARQREVEFTIP
ncbi:MAG: glycogen debranching enzyme GlgX, partial [Actinobacteria bacterium]|nr:glycogen debranching enzyme GlgX [Actinomycetota bacterium]